MSEAEDGSDGDFKPRPYQVAIAQKAMKQNTVIYLPTGSGKTFIAVLVMKHYLSRDIRTFEEGGKLCIFVVSAVVLVDQQARVLERHLPISKAGRNAGSMDVDSYSKEQWLAQFKKHKVLVMTADILKLILSHQYLEPSQVSVLVFDECHAAVGDGPMNVIMRLVSKSEEQPRVIGLTATLLNGNVGTTLRAKVAVDALLTTFNADVGHLLDKEVLRFSTKPKEEIMGYEDYEEPCDEVITTRREFGKVRQASSVFANNPDPEADPKADMRNKHKYARIIKKLAMDVQAQLDNLGMFGANKAALDAIQHLELRKICETKFAILLSISHAISSLVAVRSALEQRMSSFAEERRPYTCSSNKVRQLLDLLLEVKNDHQGQFHCLVLVQRKTTAKILCTVLKNAASIPDFSFIKPLFIVGGSGSSDPFPYNNDEIAIMSKTALQSFRNHEANVLVATDVMEEGVDVPNCNVVIKFDKIDSYKSYVQSKGRARSADSNYVVLARQLEADNVKADLQVFGEIQDFLWTIVKYPNLDLYDEEVPQKRGHILPDTETYKTETGAVLFEMNAISILNKYCSLLKYDRYTDVSLEFEEERNQKLRCVATVSLPKVAPVQLTVTGQEKKSMKRAKQNACFQMCVELHKLGHLDNHLVPVAPGKDYEPDPAWWPHWNIADNIISDDAESDDIASDNTQGVKAEGDNMESDNAQGDNMETNNIESEPATPKKQKKKPLCKIGTSKRRSSYLSQVADWLVDCRPQSGKPSYLHLINIVPNEDNPPTDQKYAVIYQELAKKGSYAIVSSKALPKVCSFPVFTAVGELQVTVVPNFKNVTLNRNQHEELRSFNERFFSRMTMCTDSSSNPKGGGKDYFIVPIKPERSGVSIDWDAVGLSSELDVDRPSAFKRKRLTVSNESHYGTMVTRWYIESGLQVHLVTKVCTDMNGRSPFPDQNMSFAERYKIKYGIDLMRPELPLLEVKPWSRRVNCLVKRQDVKNLVSRSNLHFLPELVVQLPMSGTLWLKGSLLPSILYRIERLLVAEQLRQRIVSDCDSKLGKVEVPPDFEWKPLEEEKETERMQVDRSSPNCRTEAREARKKYPLLQNVEEQDINYLMGYHSLLNLKSAVGVETDFNEYEDVPKVDIPWQRLLRSAGAREGLQQREIFTALTAPSAGDLVNYERLETLGDSFLKLAVSLFLYEACPLKSEGLLSDLKVRFLGNRNLFCCALSKQLPQLLAVGNVAQGCEWFPPNFPSYRPASQKSAAIEDEVDDAIVSFPDLSKPELVRLDDVQRGSHFFGARRISDKTVADCVEALIGASLTDCGWEGAFDILIWLQVLPETVERPNKDPIQVKHLLENGFQETVSAASETLPIEVKNIQELLGYSFTDPRILKQALTHPSYDPNNSYERLEFVGDAVLDYLMTTYIYDHCGLLSPGQLTDLRSALVNNITFASLTVKYGLNRYMLSNSPTLLQAVDRFIKGRKDSKHAIDNDVLILCEEGEIMISEAVTVPKALADMYEALAGAIFFDSGRDLNAVWSVFYPLMHDVIESFCKNVPIEPVRELYERVDAVWKDIDQCGQNRRVDYQFNHDAKHHKMVATCTVLLPDVTQRYHGYGVNRKMAKRAAAKYALHSLNKSGSLRQI